VQNAPTGGRRNPTLHRRPDKGGSFWWKTLAVFFLGLLVFGGYRLYHQKVASKRF